MELKALFSLVELLVYTVAAALSIAVWVQSHRPEWVFVSLGILSGFLRFVVTLLTGLGVIPLRFTSPVLGVIIETALALLPLLFLITAFILYLVRKSRLDA